MRRVACVCALLVLLAMPGFSQGDSPALSAEAALERMPVQSRGRMKPLDTFARECVQTITGKSRWQAEAPALTLMRWWSDPVKGRTLEVIEIKDEGLKAELGFDQSRRWFSLAELSDNAELAQRRETIHQRLEGDEELPPEDRKVQEVLTSAGLLASILDGSGLKLVPHPGGLQQPWGALSDLAESPALAAAEQLKTQMRADGSALGPAVLALELELSKLGPTPEPSSLDREVRYNKSHPFRLAWGLYLSAFLVLLIPAGSNAGGRLYRLAVSLAVGGFLVHLYGFYLRCLIAGRPPVTNMYESVIWVALGAVSFAFVLERYSHRGSFLPAACLCSAVCLILADSLPTVLDPAIHPLTPVLRSNFWLTVHVLSITLGYAAFVLALGIGHLALWRAARGSQEVATLHDAVYKAVQIGVLFLAAGTILGGVWANDSWGRFWGWDPKEVWALIALLGYLAILHGRYAGWLRKFGVTAWSVLAFQGVLMAWYGVNYVLGTGLHSYGFGTGGGGYVAGFVLFELLYVGWAVAQHHQLARRLRETHSGGCPFTRLASLFQDSTNQGDT